MRRWVKRSLADRISGHVQTWEKNKKAPPICKTETCPFVTISFELGCRGVELGYRLAEALNERCRSESTWAAYDRELLDKVAGKMQLRREIIDSMDDCRRDGMIELFDTLIHKRVEDAVLFRKLAEVARSLAIRGHVVLVGRGCYMITQDLPYGLHVRLTAPPAWRVERYAEIHQTDHRQAKKKVAQGDRQRAKFMRTFFAHDVTRSYHHHLVIDDSRFGLEQITRIVLGALEACFG